MNRTQTLIGIIIILTLIIISQAFANSYDIHGVWAADTSFLEDAQLSTMTLYIGDTASKGIKSTTYAGYLYADNAQGAIEDQPVNIQLTPTSSGDGCLWYKAEIDSTNNWDGDIKIRVCPKKHLMTVISDDTVYAELYKDNILTDYANRV